MYGSVPLLESVSVQVLALVLVPVTQADLKPARLDHRRYFLRPKPDLIVGHGPQNRQCWLAAD
jgi:hypothetical protein